MRTLYAIIFVFILFIQLLKAGSWEIFNKGNSELPSNKVMKITQDGNGIYWLACLSEFDSTGTLLESLGGLVRFDGIEFKMILDTSNSPISSNGVFDLSVYDYNSLIVLSKSNEFLLIENVETKLPQIRSYNSNNSPIPGNLWYVNSDSLNNIWIATEDDGLIKIPPGNREPDSWIFFNDENTIDGIHDLNYIESYSNDDIWIGTDFYGLIHYDGNNWNRVIDPYDDISQTGHYRFTTLEKMVRFFLLLNDPKKL
jgi:ligand-binding sensor domain-containing protein